jgi:hypothetical protein
VSLGFIAGRIRPTFAREREKNDRPHEGRQTPRPQTPRSNRRSHAKPHRKSSPP